MEGASRIRLPASACPRRRAARFPEASGRRSTSSPPAGSSSSADARTTECSRTTTSRRSSGRLCRREPMPLQTRRGRRAPMPAIAHQRSTLSARALLQAAPICSRRFGRGRLLYLIGRSLYELGTRIRPARAGGTELLAAGDGRCRRAGDHTLRAVLASRAGAIARSPSLGRGPFADREPSPAKARMTVAGSG